MQEDRVAADATDGALTVRGVRFQSAAEAGSEPLYVQLRQAEREEEKCLSERC